MEPKVHFRVHKSPPLVSIVNHMNPVHTLTPNSLISILLILSSHLLLGLPSGLLPSGIPTKILYTFLISTIRVTCPVKLVPLDLITLILFNYWSPSACSLLQPPTTSSLLGPNILLSTLFSNTLNLRSSLSVRHQPSLVGCPRLLIQYIPSYPPYL
jgi:hypothetical protein